MRSSKNSHLITVRAVQYRWRVKGNDECISIGIWPVNNLGPYIGGTLGYHNTWVSTGHGISTSAGDPIVVTSRLIKRIIEHAISEYRYDPTVRGKQFDLRALDDIIKWDDAVRASNKLAAGNAGIAPRLTIEHHWPGVPEPGC